MQKNLNYIHSKIYLYITKCLLFIYVILYVYIDRLRIPELNVFSFYILNF